MAASLVRTALALLVVAGALVLIATHGVRAIGVLVAVALALAIPRTRAFRQVERVLVLLTGSRRRAAVLVALVIIGAAAVYNVLQFVH